jgi:hypothetical protein
MNTLLGVPVPSPTHEPETIYFSIWPDVRPVWSPLMECGAPDVGARRFQTLIVPPETMRDLVHGRAEQPTEEETHGRSIAVR